MSSIFDIPKYIEVSLDVHKINPEYILMGLLFLIMIWLGGTILIIFIKGMTR